MTIVEKAYIVYNKKNLLKREFLRKPKFREIILYNLIKDNLGLSKYDGYFVR